MLWDDEQSCPFNIKEAILSPCSTACIFVNELLVTMEQLALGVKIGSVYFCTQMYADDLALIVFSAQEVQATVDVSHAVCY